MKTIGTDGKYYIINSEKNSSNIYDENFSSLHLEVRCLLKKCFPYSRIYEEVLLSGCKGIGGTLRADFLIPDLKIIVEANGRQHYEYTEYFHKDEKSFFIYQKNDEIKKDWALDNNITYIELPYNKKNEWENIIHEHT